MNQVFIQVGNSGVVSKKGGIM